MINKFSSDRDGKRPLLNKISSDKSDRGLIYIVSMYVCIYVCVCACVARAHACFYDILKYL
jgi:hypothetical protein